MTQSPSPHTNARPAGIFGRLMDEGRFLRQWANNPLGVGAITPSGPDLARAMASFLDPQNAGLVVELGPGTGVVTQAILARGIAPENLISIEYCARFAELLRDRFDGVRIVQGDAYALGETLGAHPPLAGIVSSLPLLTKSYGERRALVLDALDHLQPGAPFIQFSYGLRAPLNPEPGLITMHKTGWIWNNMPPARVWVYRKPAN